MNNIQNNFFDQNSDKKEKKELVPKDENILGKGNTNNQTKKVKEYQDYTHTLKVIKNNILYHLITLPDEKLIACIHKIEEDGFTQFFKAFMFDYYYKIKYNNNLKMIILINMQRLENMVFEDLNNVLMANGIRFDGIYIKHDKTEINAINLLRKSLIDTASAIDNVEYDKGPLTKKQTVGELRDSIIKKFNEEYNKL